ncbi:hypothetical protein B4147_1957 [Bacillus wiedmannii]|uniref:Uncharacterized protein n=1 Tax=Bacillus wiedmannii TaxID=1890302 RepID=A0A0G8C0U7_9BACI|nr:hypothetical protein B4147_1957 [Bacillus wiedmannii]
METTGPFFILAKAILIYSFHTSIASKKYFNHFTFKLSDLQCYTDSSE